MCANSIATATRQTHLQLPIGQLGARKLQLLIKSGKWLEEMHKFDLSTGHIEIRAQAARLHMCKLLHSMQRLCANKTPIRLLWMFKQILLNYFLLVFAENNAQKMILENFISTRLCFFSFSTWWLIKSAVFCCATFAWRVFSAGELIHGEQKIKCARKTR